MRPSAIPAVLRCSSLQFRLSSHAPPTAVGRTAGHTGRELSRAERHRLKLSESGIPHVRGSERKRTAKDGRSDDSVAPAFFLVSAQQLTNPQGRRPDASGPMCDLAEACYGVGVGDGVGSTSRVGSYDAELIRPSSRLHFAPSPKSWKMPQKIGHEHSASFGEVNLHGAVMHPAYGPLSQTVNGGGPPSISSL